MLKREMEYKKQFLENMAVSLQNIIHRQYQELEKGVFNFGEYRLHNDYKHLSVSTLNWTQLNKDQKCEKLTKVFRYKAEFTNSTRHTHVPSVLSETYSALTGTIYKAHELRDVLSKAGVLATDKSILTKLLGNKTCVDCPENVYIVQGNEKLDWFSCTCAGTCNYKCQNFIKFKVFCEHTIATSEIEGTLQKYVQEIKVIRENISWYTARKTREAIGGKKSRKGKNDPNYRPVITTSVPIFTEPFHNGDEFDFLKDEKRAKRCAACGIEFPKSLTIQLFDLVMQHPERYMYPQKKDGDIKWVYTAHEKRATFYHCQPECILKMHPYFTSDKINISEEVRNKLKPCHLKMLQSHLTWICNHL